MSYKIKQLGLGGILDQGIAVTKNHFGLLYTIMLLLWIPWNLVLGFIQLSMMPAIPPNPTMNDLMRLQAAQMKILPITLPLSLIAVFVLFPLTNAAIIYAIAGQYLGKPVTALEAIKHGLKKIAPLIWTFIIMGLAIMGGLILLVVPGILFSLWFGLSQHVVVLEGLSGAKALGRSKQLVRPYLGTFLGLGIIVMVIAVAVQLGANFIPQAHVKLLVSVLISAAMTILSSAVFVVFYFSCRCGVENFDLEHLASAVGESVVAIDEVEEVR